MELALCKGLSDKRIAELKKLNINTLEELIKHYPRTYLDLTKVNSVRTAMHNERILTIAKVNTIPTVQKGGRVNYVKVYCTSMGDNFTIIWFNQPYVASKLKVNVEYLFYGRITNKMGVITMTNPTFEEVDKNYRLKGIVPVYSIKGNLTQSVMKNSIINAINIVKPTSIIPENVLRKYSLSDLKNAYYTVHNPPNELALKNASDRIALEEYFSLISAFKVIKGDKKCQKSHKYSVSASVLKDFTNRFGFEFTDGQKKAVNEIYADLKSPFIMNRLLQGDVGSGKTAVAFTAVFMAVKSGYQAVVLAPTEVLAMQNYALIKKYFSEYNVAFLSGSVSQKDKKELKSKIQQGDVDIVVGTHAVLEKDVVFKNLVLCVCDEQQRFGVAQRSGLLSKGESPDVLVMSATPIPRTLSLIFYGDLDISTILDKPVNRATVKTNVVPYSKYEDMLGFIDKEISSKRQVYFVCPKIEGDDEGTVISVTELYEELKSLLPSAKIGLLHGKMKDKEKNQIMQDFKDKKYDALCSTTVIEVGVDVPNATVMVIYNADRFGLSQLHQLRGRVGRSDLQSYCFLLNGSESDKAKDRLNIMCTVSDGFKISEVDYDIRGGGEFLGEKQSGKFMTELNGLKYSSSVIFFAKTLTEEAFSDPSNVMVLNKLAKQKYYALKDITLN